MRQYELSLAKLADLHLDYLRLIKTGVFSFFSWQSQLNPKVVLIEKVIAEEMKFNRILMTAHEWESGY